MLCPFGDVCLRNHPQLPLKTVLDIHSSLGANAARRDLASSGEQHRIIKDFVPHYTLSAMHDTKSTSRRFSQVRGHSSPNKCPQALPPTSSDMLFQRVHENPMVSHGHFSFCDSFPPSDRRTSTTTDKSMIIRHKLFFPDRLLVWRSRIHSGASEWDCWDRRLWSRTIEITAIAVSSTLL